MFTRVMPGERTVRDAANALKRAAQERERDARRADKERAAFLRTPVGQARAAFERGDRVFQCALEVERQDAVILNAIAREGWELVSGVRPLRARPGEARHHGRLLPLPQGRAPPAVAGRAMIELHDRGRAQVLELFVHLDRPGPMGDRQIAHYGELRAAEMSHDLALERTIARFRLREQAWYQAQLTRARTIADGATAPPALRELRGRVASCH